MFKNRQKEAFQKKSGATFWEQVNEIIRPAHHVPTREKQEEENHVST